MKLFTNSDRLIETFTKAGVAYVGYKSTNHWTGSLTALVALKLAQGGNLAAGIGGMTILGLMGLTDLLPREGYEASLKAAERYFPTDTRW